MPPTVAAFDIQDYTPAQLVMIAVLVGLVLYVWYFPAVLARRRHHPKTGAIVACVWLSLIVWPVWLVALVWAYTAPETKNPIVVRPDDSPGYLLARQKLQDKERKAGSPVSRSYVVAGVDRESGFETELLVNATTEANAKAKAKLKGMVVTDVRPA